MLGAHTTFMASIRHAASQVWLFNLLVLWRPLLDCGCLLFKFSFSTICSSSGNSTWSSDRSLYFRSNLQLEFFFKNTYYSQLWFALVLSQLHLALVFLSCGLALVWSQLRFGAVFVWVVHFIVLSQLWFAVHFVFVAVWHWFCLNCDLKPVFFLSQLWLAPTLVPVAIWYWLQL